MDKEFLNAVKNDDFTTVERIVNQRDQYLDLITIKECMLLAAKLHNYIMFEYLLDRYRHNFYQIYDDIVKQALLDNDIENIQYVYKVKPSFEPRWISGKGFDQTLQYLKMAVETENDDIIQLVMDHTQLSMYHLIYILSLQDIKYVKMAIQARVAPFAIIRQLDAQALPEEFKNEILWYIFNLPQVVNDPSFFKRLSDYYKSKYVEMMVVQPSMALRGLAVEQGDDHVRLPIQIVEQILQDSYNIDSSLGLTKSIQIIQNVFDKEHIPDGEDK